MTVLLDTNVVVDVFQHRSGWETTQQILEWCLPPGRNAVVTWPTVAILAYLLEAEGHAAHDIGAKMRVLLNWFSVCASGPEALKRAIELRFDDFEDALQAAFAEACGANAIVTRNVRDFSASPVVAMTPEDFLLRFAQ
jgi:predicted nucleic acid-binding protein